ncbi:MAG: alpha-glucosidase C-terminal domain-containing protein [Bacteroidia bacterium]
MKLRKSLPELVYGAYQLLDANNKQVYAYTRALNNKKLVVVMNFSDKNALFTIPLSAGKPGQVLINNLNDFQVKNSTVHLLAYQALIIRLK